MIHRFEHCRFCGGLGCAACPSEAAKWEKGGGAFPPGKAPGPKPPPPHDLGPCYACPNPARFLCDGRVMLIPEASDGTPTTCDRPMCGRHVAYQARIHLQMAGPGGRGRRCRWDTVDYCPDCLARLEAQADRAQHPQPEETHGRRP